MILNGLLFFLFIILHGVCVLGIMGYIFGGGSYSSVYVPPPMFVSPVILVVYIPMFFIFPFILYLVCLFLGTHFPQALLFPNCVTFTMIG